MVDQGATERAAKRPPVRTAARPRETAILLALGALATLPLWIARFPPLVDYPQQLAQAAVLRWYQDPVRHFAENYEIWWPAPHSLFKFAVAGLAFLVPIEIAGKLVVGGAIAALAPAALALCRRIGRPWWYALGPLALAYNQIFFAGFVDNLLAYPLSLGALALADRLCRRARLGVGGWCALAGTGLLFYGTHLQFLLVFALAVGALALIYQPRRVLIPLSSLLPVLVLVAVVMTPAWSQAPNQREAELRQAGTDWMPWSEKLAQLPAVLFGGRSDGTLAPATLLLITLAAVVLLTREHGPGGAAPGTEEAADTEPPAFPGRSPVSSARARLIRARFALLAAGLLLLYFLLPEWMLSYLMVAERFAPLAGMVFLVALPAPAPGRRLVVATLVAGLFAIQLGATTAGAARFARDTRGFGELLAATAPGENIAGLIFDNRAGDWLQAPALVHFPAYYQVLRGGRPLLSFGEYYHMLARLRPGRSWQDLLRQWDDWHPWLFSFPRDGGRFRYFVVRGTLAQVAGAFGRYSSLVSVRRFGDWYLVERRPSAPPAGATRSWQTPGSRL